MNSRIILCKGINVDKEYNNVLDYTEQEMLTLCNQSNHKVADANNYSFIREHKNSILVNFTYQQCLQSNYIAFQNTDYSSKWFFAWIDEVNYKSNNATEIVFTVDAWSTWFDKWTTKSCFVLREHVSNDSIGANTVPENLETGEYIQLKAPTKLNNYDNGIAICVAVSDFPSSLSPSQTQKTINGIYAGLKYCIFSHSDGINKSAEWVDEFINMYDSDAKASAISSIFLVPKAFAITDHATAIPIGSQGHFFYLPNENTNFNTLVESVSITMPTTQGGGYQVKNNKLKCYPYNYFVVTNNAGTDVIFNYEDFVNNSPSFKIIGDITPGCSIRCVPLNYKKIADSNGSMNSYNYGIQGGKFPICPWVNDTYTNWLTENGISTGLGIVGGLVLTAGAIGSIYTGGLSMAGATALIGGISSIAGTMASVYSHSLAPDQGKGNTSAGDITYTAGNNVFTVYQMGLREEWAKRIDDYFQRFGYQVNKVKTPAMSSRTYWNFVQIGQGEDIGTGDVPNSYMEIINQTARKGVTIWHQHSNIGNFSLDN